MHGRQSQFKKLVHAVSRSLPQSCDAAVPEAQRNGWLIDLPDRFCHRCGASAGQGACTPRGCPACVGQRIAWDKMVRLSAYSTPMKDWIVAMKFQRDWSWAKWFGTRLAERIELSTNGDRVVVCPVPMHWRRRVWRGYNQAQLIASAMARSRGWPVASLLRRTSFTRPQTGMAPARRQANARRSFSDRCINLTGWSIWLVDDVKTTGATLTACARLLRRAGAQQVNAAVAAVADPRR